MKLNNELNTTHPEFENFIGSSTFKMYSKLFPRIVLTEGVVELASKLKCYWLIDLIASHDTGKLRKEEFLACKLKVCLKKASAVLTIEDGNYNKLKSQKIQFTDFSLSGLDIWAVDNGEGYRVLMLPSEY